MKCNKSWKVGRLEGRILEDRKLEVECWGLERWKARRKGIDCLENKGFA